MYKVYTSVIGVFFFLDYDLGRSLSYGPLLVRCHRVVNKGCRLSPSASLRFLSLRINCALCFRRRRALRLAFIASVFAHPFFIL